jgi:hypothetical protein
LREGAKGIEVGVDIAHEKARAMAAGMTPKEIEEEGKLALELEAKYPSIGQPELLHMIRNARSIVGTYEEAALIMDPLAKLRVTAQAVSKNPGEVEGEFDKLLKGWR